jgi:E-phenylitaconyl-CoA hydratase
MSDVVLFEKRGATAIVTINRPERRNAVSEEVKSELLRRWRQIRDDDDILTAILTGTGESFCAGGDLGQNLARAKGELKPTYEGMETRGMKTYAGVLREIDLFKPIIAAVNGYAAGGGLQLALNCDIRLCSDNAQFGCSEVRWSHMAAGQALFMSKTIPLGWAFKLALTGQFINAQQAYDAGIVQGVYPPEQLMDEALTLADQINANGPIVTQTTKEFVYNAMDMPFAVAQKVGRVYYAAVRDSPDYHEGSAAFIQKRKPGFSGKKSGFNPKG